jgi:hypothetical protein
LKNRYPQLKHFKDYVPSLKRNESSSVINEVLPTSFNVFAYIFLSIFSIDILSSTFLRVGGIALKSLYEIKKKLNLKTQIKN